MTRNAKKANAKIDFLNLERIDWTLHTVGELITFSGGSQPPQSTFIYESRNGYTRLIQTRDYRTEKYKTYIPSTLVKKTCGASDIMIGRYGPPLFQIFRGLEGAYNVALIKAIPNAKVDLEYCYYFLSRPELREYLEGLSQRSGGQTGIEMDKLNEYPFPLPPFKVQKRIAEVLQGWDRAIQIVTNTITQTQLRKKWIIHQLLTGRLRVIGFENQAWKKMSAGDVFKNVSIKGNLTEQLLSATQDKGMIPRDMLEGRVTMPNGDTSSFKLVEPGDFVISLRSFQGGLEYSYYRGLVSPAYTVLKPKGKINDEFYKQYFKSYDFIGHLATAVIGIRDGKQISFDDFCLVQIPNPSYEEQTAIAKILMTADKELELLNQKLDKLKEQKKGLMQVLLTGEKDYL